MMKYWKVPTVILAALTALAVLGGKAEAMWNVDKYQEHTQNYITESRVRAERQDTLIEQQAEMIKLFHAGRNNGR
jgi:hypothetical protein